MNAPSLFERAERWLAHDPDPDARAELAALIERARTDDAARADLGERFVGPLEFGTAGLRGLLGAGESRMNRAVVRRTSFGLGQHLLAEDAVGARARGVVVGYDGRHLGRELAEDTACVLAALGIPARITPRPCPTPLLAFAVTSLGAVAGVMVTASHNPPAYNGYKVYWGNGAQIIPPHDQGIAARDRGRAGGRRHPRLGRAEAERAGLVALFGDDVERRYLDAVRGLAVRSDGDRSLPIVYTPAPRHGRSPGAPGPRRGGLHRRHHRPRAGRAGRRLPHRRLPQPGREGRARSRPGPGPRAGGARWSSPTIPTPTASPSRCAATTARTCSSAATRWARCSGTTCSPRAGAPTGDRLVLASLVSSPMLGVIARALGVRYEETLTGFKWIANRAMDAERETGARFVFGFEEALGYTVGSVVRDKDGISAAVLAAELAAVRRAEGLTLLDELEALARRYGLFVSGQRSITLPGSDGAARIGAIMARLRAAPPARLGAWAVLASCDYQARTRTAADGAVTPIALPPSNVLTFELDGRQPRHRPAQRDGARRSSSTSTCASPWPPGRRSPRPSSARRGRWRSWARRLAAAAGVS